MTFLLAIPAFNPDAAQTEQFAATESFARRWDSYHLNVNSLSCSRFKCSIRSPFIELHDSNLLITKFYQYELIAENRDCPSAAADSEDHDETGNC